MKRAYIIIIINNLVMGQHVERCACLRKTLNDEVITADLNTKAANPKFVSDSNISTKSKSNNTKSSKLKIFQGLLTFNLSSSENVQNTPEVKIEKVIKGFLFRIHYPQIKKDLLKEESKYISDKEKEYISSNIKSTLKLYNDKSKLDIVKSFYAEKENDIEKFRTSDTPYNTKVYKTKLLLKTYEGCPSIYEGETNILYEQNGEGSLYTTIGTMYKGIWKKGEFTGWGVHIDQDGNLFEGKFQNGIINGKGLKLTQNDTLFIGELSNFLKEGKGYEETPEHIYEGQFKNDMKEGQGKLSYKNCNDVYQGEFKENNITGFGFYIWDNKHTYLGEFINGKMHGRGTYKWPDGSEYDGEYINNIKEGNGIFKWADGRIFKGTFKNGKPHGFGKLSFKGIDFDAEFINGKLNGDLK